MEPKLPDLFPGFDEQTVETSLARLYCRTGGSGPPLLLLHGYPQSHVIWHKIAPLLSKQFTLVMPDLPGYGRSSIPPLSQTHGAYSKRAVGAAMLELMQTLGHDSFLLAGHDRGARVGYRMTLDSPNAVRKLAVLDILPTLDYWHRMDRGFGLKIYHWMFLAQPAPFPENMIGAAPIDFLEHTLASWTAKKSLACFSEEALDHNRAWFLQPERIAATCEDYRAGATIDYEHDLDDRRAGKILQTPLLVLAGEKGIANGVDDPVSVWRRWCSQVSGILINTGHFLPEEAPAETGKEILRFMSGNE